MDKDTLESMNNSLNDPKNWNIEYLKKALVGVNLKNEISQGVTLLHEACYKNCLNIVKLLIESKVVNVNRADRSGNTPLHLACWDGTDAIELLVENGADVNIKNNFLATPLHIACDKGDVDKVRFLVKSGAKINVTDIVGGSPLKWASKKQRADVIDYLIENGAKE